MKRLFSLLMALALALSCLQLTGFAQAPEAVPAEGEVVATYTLSLDQLQLGHVRSAYDAPALAPGTHTQYIDRVALPDFARDFYQVLVEGSDGDGVEDVLIDDASYQSGKLFIGSFDCGSDYQGWWDDDGQMISQYIRMVYDSFDRDHPEVFWLNGTSKISAVFSGWIVNGEASYTADIYFMLEGTVDENGVPTPFDIRYEEYRSEDAIRDTMNEIEDEVEDWLEGAGSTPYEQLCYFNRRLTEINEYNTVVSGTASGTAPESAWTCVSALLGNTGVNGPVCEGYARAFKVLCDAAGIPCILVDNMGCYGNVEDHMWNYVELGDSWYGVDVTWNDPVVNGVSGALSGYERETYLLVGGDTVIDGERFLDSHPVGNTLHGLAYTNGPAVSTQAYDPNTAVEPYVKGDINGDGSVNNKDATRLFQYLSNWDVVVVEEALDVNGDGNINNKDATRLFQYLSNWDVEIH